VHINSTVKNGFAKRSVSILPDFISLLRKESVQLIVYLLIKTLLHYKTTSVTNLDCDNFATLACDVNKKFSNYLIIAKAG
jgi:hypothetical protein